MCNDTVDDLNDKHDKEIARREEILRVTIIDMYD